GADSPFYATELTNLGSNLLLQKKHADAGPVLREALEILQKKQPDTRETFDALALLGAALLGREKYADAELLLLQAYQGMRKPKMDQGHERHDALTERRFLEGLIQLYDAWGKPDEAAKWRQELEATTKAAEQHGQPKEK